MPDSNAHRYATADMNVGEEGKNKKSLCQRFDDICNKFTIAKEIGLKIGN